MTATPSSLLTLALLLPLAVSAQWMQLDCSSLEDGVYGEECSSSVSLCLQGELLNSVCPQGALFNARAARCLPYESEAACLQGNALPPRDARPCTDIGSNWRRGEGACSPQYNLCLNGESHTLFCPPTFFYDEAESACSTEPSDCFREDDWRADSGEEDVASICAAAGKDGFYGMGCSSSFAACAAGTARVMGCPADLVYDETRQKCEYPGNVEVCGGVAPEEGSGVEGSGEEGSGSEGSGEIEGSGEGSGEETEETEDITDACREHADGFYRLGACAEHFLGCSGGFAYRMSCPASLKYSEETQMCDYPGNVAGCDEDEESSGEEEGSGEGSGEIEEGSGTEGSGTEGSGTEGSGSEGSGTEGSGIVAESAPIFQEDIVETEDEIVANNGHDVKDMEAEDDIIYDATEEKEKLEEIGTENDVIDNAGETAEKVEEKPLVTEDETVDAAVEKEEVDEISAVGLQQVQQPATAAAATVDDESDASRSCSGRGDGFFALGCSSEMLACSNGIAHIMPCPAGLVFDESNQMCDYPTQVSACADREQLLSEDNLLTREEVTGRDHPHIPRRSDEATVDATLAPTTPAASVERTHDAGKRDSRCKSSNGFFSLGCSTQFVACTEGVATTVDCAEGEAFDEHAQSCVALARHPHCFAHVVREPTTDDVTDAAMVKEADDEKDLQKPVDHSFPCSREGAYAESECSDWFTLCKGGRGLELYCLQGYLFDGTAAKCLPAGQLAHCQAH
ncbi:hypothetical protein PFISCL1PPCAC_22969 [Pristionchus fissidentatus]|uniref:Chitin-binding type-2 domain-containing protein n=1 Tax=Pristionchus fissidentatus TaxID=1538716 RepID=A0AAV5WIB2_9BILA|nr:hypothetical protein PFISCL1PPCAC_22969 [Pristionchus fissidentatus]